MFILEYLSSSEINFVPQIVYVNKSFLLLLNVSYLIGIVTVDFELECFEFEQ